MRTEDSMVPVAASSGPATRPYGVKRSTRRQMADRTRDGLIDAAAWEFFLHGVRGTLVSDIVARADSSTGSFHHHFGSKEAIAELLVTGRDDRWPELIAGVRDSRRGLDAVRELCRLVAVELRDNIRVRAGLRIERELREGAGSPQPFLRWTDVLTYFLQQSITDGEIPESMDVHRAAELIVHHLWGEVSVAEVSGTSAGIEQQLDRAWEVMFRAIRNTPLLP